MKKILWTQNENPSIPNTIVNSEGNVISVDAVRDGGFELFDELLEYQKSGVDVLLKNNLVVKRNKQKGVTSETIGYFIKSVYDNKDNKGRLMPFMFYIESRDPKEVLEVLETCSTKLNRKLFNSDLHNIELVIKKNKFKKKIIVTIVIILMIIILFKIWIIN